MRRLAPLLLSLALLLGAGASQAQPPTAPPREAAQFDFLIGQWEIELTPKVNSLAAMIHGKPRLLGSWKAWRAFEGFGIEDELRVTDGSGNPASLALAQRIFDTKNRRWLISSLDVYRQRFSSATAQWQDGEMRASGQGQSSEGRPFISRSRFHEITPERFRMSQDRSFDEGRSWEEGVLTISARRVAAKAVR